MRSVHCVSGCKAFEIGRGLEEFEGMLSVLSEGLYDRVERTFNRSVDNFEVEESNGNSMEN